VIDRAIKAEKAVIDAEVEQHRAREWRAHTTSNQEWRKHERYCRECHLVRFLACFFGR